MNRERTSYLVVHVQLAVRDRGAIEQRTVELSHRLVEAPKALADEEGEQGGSIGCGVEFVEGTAMCGLVVQYPQERLLCSVVSSAETE